MERLAKVVMAVTVVTGVECCGATQVAVCMSRSSGAMFSAARAQGIAGRMFAGIGIEVGWHKAGRDCPVDAIIVSLTEDTPKGLLPGAVAYALPYEGTRVRVFFDRVHQRSVERSGLEVHLLAHVLVHEITHILQGVSVHSDSGVMKASWDREDYSRMMGGGLGFAEEDVVLIRNSMETRAARLAGHYNSSGS